MSKKSAKENQEPEEAAASIPPAVAEAEEIAPEEETPEEPAPEDPAPQEDAPEGVAEGEATETAEDFSLAPASAEEGDESAEQTGPTDEEIAAAEDAYSLRSVVEAVLFASQKPVSVKELTNILKGAASADAENLPVAQFSKVREPHLREAVDALNADYEATVRAFEIRETAAGWQLVSRPEFSPWLRQLFPENRPAKLSAPAVETLAIIAYRQPLTRADIEAVRGVAVDGVMQTLLDRGFIRIVGRADIPGRPLLYGTTQHFLEHFGLKDLEELPNAGELRKLVAPPVKATPAPLEGSEGIGEESTPPEAAAAEMPTEPSVETPAKTPETEAEPAAGLDEVAVPEPEEMTPEISPDSSGETDAASSDSETSKIE